MNPVVIIVIVVILLVAFDIIRDSRKKKLERKGNAPAGTIRDVGSLQAVHKPNMERLQRLPIAPSPEEYTAGEELEPHGLPPSPEVVDSLIREDDEAVVVLSAQRTVITVETINDLVSKWLARSHANPIVTTPKEGYALGITECIQDILVLTELEKEE